METVALSSCGCVGLNAGQHCVTGDHRGEMHEGDLLLRHLGE